MERGEVTNAFVDLVISPYDAEGYRHAGEAPDWRLLTVAGTAIVVESTFNAGEADSRVVGETAQARTRALYLVASAILYLELFIAA